MRRCGDCCRGLLLSLFVKNLILVWLVSSVLGSPSLKQAQANSLQGCPCSPLLSSIVYEMLPKQLIAKYPNAFVYVDDIAIIVKPQEELASLFADLSVWGSQIRIRFNPDKTKVFHFHGPSLPSPESRNTCGGETAVYRYATLSSPTWGTPLPAPDIRERQGTPSLHPYKPK